MKSDPNWMIDDKDYQHVKSGWDVSNALFLVLLFWAGVAVGFVMGRYL